MIVEVWIKPLGWGEGEYIFFSKPERPGWSPAMRYRKLWL